MPVTRRRTGFRGGRVKERCAERQKGSRRFCAWVPAVRVCSCHQALPGGALVIGQRWNIPARRAPQVCLRSFLFVFDNGRNFHE